jgi:hypothetical protein
MPCQIQVHFGFELDEQDNRDFELGRSHGKQTDGSSDSALDGAEPLLTNCKGNTPLEGWLEAKLIHFHDSFISRLVLRIVDTESAREHPCHH